MNIFDEYISAAKASEYREVKKYSGMITHEQALLDIKNLCYIMNNRYSGKDYWERKGINFDSCYNEISKGIGEDNEIYIGDLCRIIHRTFDIGIVDNHLSFASPSTGKLGFSKKYSAYFTNIIAEKRGGEYIVYKSNEAGIKTGDIINSKENLYPTLSPIGRSFYLVGRSSWTSLNFINIKVNEKEVTVSVHRCGAVKKIEEDYICLQHTNLQGIDVIRSNCCESNEAYVEENVIDFGNKFSKTKALIWDNLSNCGGYSRYPKNFIKGLNGYVNSEEYCAKLISPITENKACKREWILNDAKPYDYEKAKYEGVLYFLINSDTASSGETSVLFAKSVKKLVLIGENSFGCNTFGNVAAYALPNSGIVLRIPNMINLCKNPEDCIEGIGFTPDFWVDNDEVQAETIKWLNNKETYIPSLNA